MCDTPIRLLLVDDHVSYSRAIGFWLDHEPDLHVVAQASSLAAARAVLQDQGAAIDVARVDLDLPDGSGIALIHELHACNPEASAIVLTGSTSAWDRAQAIAGGAAELIHKSVDIPEIATACRRLHAGETLIPPQELIDLLRLVSRRREEDAVVRQALRRLTTREREVLQALAHGQGDKEIAERLGISTKTARGHVVNLIGKLGVESRLQAVILAARIGVIDLRVD